MISGIIIEGLIYGIMVLGVFTTFRVLNFCDMTVDGSFPMGACVLAACLTHGISPVAGLLIAFIAGMLAGLVTSLIYTKLHIPDLLAGILTMQILSRSTNIMSFAKRHCTLTSFAITMCMFRSLKMLQPKQATMRQLKLCATHWVFLEQNILTPFATVLKADGPTVTKTKANGVVHFLPEDTSATHTFFWTTKTALFGTCSPWLCLRLKDSSADQHRESFLSRAESVQCSRGLFCASLHSYTRGSTAP